MIFFLQKNVKLPQTNTQPMKSIRDGVTKGITYSKDYDFVYSRCFKCGSAALSRSLWTHFSERGKEKARGIDFRSSLPKDADRIRCYVTFIRK